LFPKKIFYFFNGRICQCFKKSISSKHITLHTSLIDASDKFISQTNCLRFVFSSNSVWMSHKQQNILSLSFFCVFTHSLTSSASDWLKAIIIESFRSMPSSTMFIVSNFFEQHMFFNQLSHLGFKQQSTKTTSTVTFGYFTFYVFNFYLKYSPELQASV
jgi:hypothetical protein